jgi:Holliday junction resolvase RusA-like endonuclease
MNTVVHLNPPCAFINANDRMHHQAKAKLTKQWRQYAAAALMFEPYHYTRAHIVCEIRFPDNRRRDVGNYYPTAKAIVDGLVDSLLLPDDNDRHLIGPDMRREYPNGPARVTVTIEEIPA